MTHHITTVILNGTVNKHLLEDAKCIVYYHIIPAEPDVGAAEAIVILDMESKSERPIRRIWNALDTKTQEDLYEQLWEQANG